MSQNSRVNLLLENTKCWNKLHRSSELRTTLLNHIELDWVQNLMDSSWPELHLSPWKQGQVMLHYHANQKHDREINRDELCMTLRGWESSWMSCFHHFQKQKKMKERVIRVRSAHEWLKKLGQLLMNEWIWSVVDQMCSKPWVLKTGGYNFRAVSKRTTQKHPRWQLPGNPHLPQPHRWLRCCIGDVNLLWKTCRHNKKWMTLPCCLHSSTLR